MRFSGLVSALHHLSYPTTFTPTATSTPTAITDVTTRSKTPTMSSQSPYPPPFKGHGPMIALPGRVTLSQR